MKSRVIATIILTLLIAILVVRAKCLNWGALWDFANVKPVTTEQVKQYVSISDLPENPPKFAYYYRGKTFNVVDGDTADIIIYMGFNISMVRRVRMYGINAPEMTGEEHERGVEAKNHLKGLIGDKDIILRSIDDKNDKYGRILAVIYVNDYNETKGLSNQLINVNMRMLEDEQAVVMEE